MVQKGDLIRYRDRLYSDPEPTDTDLDAWGEIGIVVELTTWVKHLGKKYRKRYEVEDNHDNWPIDAVIYINNRGIKSMAKIDDITVIKKGDKNAKK